MAMKRQKVRERVDGIAGIRSAVSLVKAQNFVRGGHGLLSRDALHEIPVPVVEDPPRAGLDQGGM